MDTPPELPARLARDLDGAFEELVRGHERLLFGLALRVVGNAHDAEEVAQDAFERVQAVLAQAPPGPDQEEAAKYASDRLKVTLRVGAGTAPTIAQARRKVVEAGERLERDALAGCVAHRELLRLLAELSPEHFDNALHRRLQTYLTEGGEADSEVVALLAELDARAAAEGIDEETGRQLLLKLRARQLRRELAEADPERIKELQGALTKILAAAGEPV